MANSLFISSIFLVVLVTPGFCQKVIVCGEEGGDIRVDCLIPPKPNLINNYEFSISKGGKETIINTNVTGTNIDPSFRGKSQVESLDSEGYRLRLFKYTRNDNITFVCKVTGESKSLMVAKGDLIPCSAISLFLHSCPWLLSCLLIFHVTQSWVLTAH